MKHFQQLLLKSFIIFIVSIIAGLCIFWLPVQARISAETFPEFAYLRFPVLIWMLATTLPFYYALFQAFDLLKLIDHQSAFSDKAVHDLRRISYCGLIIAASYFVLGVLLTLVKANHPGIVLAFLALIFMSSTIAFFANLLKLLLQEALEYKAEVDLTV
ncbi:DUF2975 domain-containing protein [Fusibacter bizertensis]